MQKEDANSAPSKGGKHKKESTHAHAPASEEVKALLESIKVPPQTKEAQIVFDAKNQQYLSSLMYKQENDGNEVSDQPRIYVYDSISGKFLPSESVDLAELLSLAPQVTEEVSDQEPKASGEGTPLGDSLSILRFIRGNKSKRLEISASGMYFLNNMFLRLDIEIS